MKRLFALVLSFSMIISLNTFHAYADSTVYDHLKRHEINFLCNESFKSFEKKANSSEKEIRIAREVDHVHWQEYINPDGSRYYEYKIRYMLTKKQTETARKLELKIVSKAKKKKKKDRLKYLYKNLIKGVKFMEGKNAYYTPYGALVLKKACCQGLSLAFVDMCQMAGYKAKIINGRDLKSRPHLWAAVKINGKWKYFDPAWDLEKTKFSYFSKSASYMKKNKHVFDYNYQYFKH